MTPDATLTSTPAGAALPPPDCPDLDSSTDQYARRFAGPLGDYLLEVQTSASLDLLRPFAGATVLDVGGGHAQLALPLAAHGYRVTVLGSADAALDRVRRMDGAGRTSLAVGDLLDPPFDDRSFDVSLSFRIMPHVSDWRRLIAGLCRVARRAVLIDYPAPVGVNALTPLLFPFKKRIEGDTRTYTLIPRRGVRRAFEDHGFDVAAEFPQFTLPMAFHRAMDRPAVSRGLESAARAARLTRSLGSPIITLAVRRDQP